MSPYINSVKQQKYERLLAAIRQELDLEPGDLNYFISSLTADYIYDKGINYNTINEVLGVLTAVTQELYRRVISLYEAQKMTDNGDLRSFKRLIKGMTDMWRKHG